MNVMTNQQVAEYFASLPPEQEAEILALEYKTGNCEHLCLCTRPQEDHPEYENYAHIEDFEDENQDFQMPHVWLNEQ